MNVSSLALPPLLPPVSAGGEHRVLLIDDHPVTREGVADLINHQTDLRVCGQASDPREGFELVQRWQPLLLVTDVAIRGTSGIELVKRALSVVPRLLVLIMSRYEELLYAPRALRAGARGYLMKDEPAETIIPAVRTILDGRVHVSPRLKARLADNLHPSRMGEIEDPLATLSDRELEVFALIGEGFTTRQIAEQLHLSVKTIDSYREHLKTKLHIDGAADLLQHAIRWSKARHII